MNAGRDQNPGEHAAEQAVPEASVEKGAADETVRRSDQFHDLDFLSPRLDVEADRVADDHHHRDAQQGRNDADRALRDLEQRVKPLQPLLIERSEEHTSELQSLMRISYAVFCLKNKTKT